MNSNICQFKYINIVMYVDVIVSFNQSSYTINENDGQVQPVITLSHPSSIDVRMRVREIQRSAMR